MNLRSRIAMTLSFMLLTPLIIFVLLYLKGLPTFAVGQLFQVILWVYGIAWAPALLAGAILAGVVSAVIQRTPYFHKPYDFGRCYSLGGIVGALAEAFATWGYRVLTQHSVSGFWIAGAIIAGFAAGSLLTSLFLTRVR